MSSRIVLRTKASKAGLADTTIDDLVRAGTGLQVNSAEVSGSGSAGSSLTVTASANHPAATLSYQWYRGASVIAGAMSTRYEPVAADVGKVITVKVTAKALGFANSVVVTATAPTITAATTGSMSEGVGISGNNWVGRTLTASTGTWAPTPT
eukprot:gene2022-2524_t